MLTFYHYLLGGFIAVSCVTSVLLTPSSQDTLSLSPNEATIDVAYRGSGRLGNGPGQSQTELKNVSQPADGQTAEHQTAEMSASHSDDGSLLLSHRGSGRIVPDAMTTRL